MCISTHFAPHLGLEFSAGCSKEKAFAVLFAPACLQRCPGSHLKHLPHTILRLCRAFHVSKGSDPVSHVPSLLSFDWLLFERKCVSDILLTRIRYSALFHGNIRLILDNSTLCCFLTGYKHFNDRKTVTFLSPRQTLVRRFTKY